MPTDERKWKLSPLGVTTTVVPEARAVAAEQERDTLRLEYDRERRLREIKRTGALALEQRVAELEDLVAHHHIGPVEDVLTQLEILRSKRDIAVSQAAVVGQHAEVLAKALDQFFRDVRGLGQLPPSVSESVDALEEEISSAMQALGYPR